MPETGCRLYIFIVSQIGGYLYQVFLQSSNKNVRSAGLTLVSIILHPLNKIVDMKDKLKGGAAAVGICTNPNSQFIA